MTLLLLLAVALVGIAHAAFLPPWEGNDETAHWSYVQQLSDTGHPPRYGRDGLAGDLRAYAGPMPYGQAPFFDHTGRLTFRDYHHAGARPVTGGPTRFSSAEGVDWQAQHPPLYYALLGPVYRATRGLGWLNHVLALRLASFAMAWAGLTLGVMATVRAKAIGPWGGAVMAAWPFLFPEFFPEFARLGNDSLCLLLAGATWALLLRWLTDRGGWATACGLGAAIGLGLLTKAFFLPIGAGVAVLLLVHWLSRGRPPHLLQQAVLAGAAALAIGGWWYACNLLDTGVLTGSDEAIRLHRAGGLTHLSGAFSIMGLLRGLAVIPASFVWSGTWSLARLPEVLLLPPVLLLAVAGFDYFRGLRRAELVDWAPVALVAPVLAGLVAHVFAWMTGLAAETPGWYLHILAAPMGFAVALGWKRRRLLGVLAGLTAAYTAAAWAFQLSMFGGCAAKIGSDKHYSLDGADCFLDLHALTGLGHPRLGFAALGIGAALVVLAAVRAWQAHRGGAALATPA